MQVSLKGNVPKWIKFDPREGRCPAVKAEGCSEVFLKKKEKG
jgi:hypothetical protein